MVLVFLTCLYALGFHFLILVVLLMYLFGFEKLEGRMYSGTRKEKKEEEKKEERHRQGFVAREKSNMIE